MLMAMAQCAIARQDLDHKRADEIIRDDKTVPGFLLDRDNVLAGIWILDQGYSFEGLNSTTTRRMS